MKKLQIQLAALKEEFNVKASAEHIKSQFGLSVERSREVGNQSTVADSESESANSHTVD